MDIELYVKEEIKDPRIVKKTISYVTDAIAKQVRKPARACAFSLARDSNYRPARLFDKVAEGEVVFVFMRTNTEEQISLAISEISNLLVIEPNMLFEIVLQINKKHNTFGLVLIQYVSPDNW